MHSESITPSWSIFGTREDFLRVAEGDFFLMKKTFEFLDEKDI
jgi:hypothetical protein